MIVRPFMPEDEEQLIDLIAHCRVTLSRFRGRAKALDLEAAAQELKDYQSPRYRLFVAEVDLDDLPLSDGDEESKAGKEPEQGSGRWLVGYLVCRIEDEVVWAESLFVSPMFRRQGIGSALYDRAERLAEEVGGDTVYNWVHPNNDRVIAFLRRRNYTVLNMLEIRRSRPDESPTQRIRVGKNYFEYCC